MSNTTVSSSASSSDPLPISFPISSYASPPAGVSSAVSVPPCPIYLALVSFRQFVPPCGWIVPHDQMQLRLHGIEIFQKHDVGIHFVILWFGRQCVNWCVLDDDHDYRSDYGHDCHESGGSDRAVEVDESGLLHLYLKED